LASAYDDRHQHTARRPETAALDLQVRAAEIITGGTAFRAVLQDLAGAVHAEGALSGLVWGDARLVAAAISFDACLVDDPVRSLRSRAAAVRARVAFEMQPMCVDAVGVVQALDVAATVLDGI
jgi:hypothetical protein